MSSSMRKGSAALFESKSSVTASPSSTGEVKSRDTETKAVGVYKGTLGEAWPSSIPRLPSALEGVIHTYLASDVDANPKRYSEEQLAKFSLFEAPLATGSQIAGYIASGARTKALELIRKNPSSLQCLALTRDGYGIGRQAAGTPLGLAVIFGDTVLAAQIKSLLDQHDPKEVNKQLKALFSSGWEEEQKERDARYINAATRFRDQLLKNRLPDDMPYEQALEVRKTSIHEYREALRPKPDDPVTTRGFMVNPQNYITVRDLFLESEADLGEYGSLDVDFLWGFGFQPLLGAGPPMLGQILIDGANKYASSDYMPTEDLAFKDRTPFYDPMPHSGLGGTFFVSFWGNKLPARGAGWVARQGAGDGRTAGFLENLCRATTSICRAYTASGETDNNDAGTSVELRRNKP